MKKVTKKEKRLSTISIFKCDWCSMKRSIERMAYLSNNRDKAICQDCVDKIVDLDIQEKVKSEFIKNENKKMTYDERNLNLLLDVLVEKRTKELEARVRLLEREFEKINKPVSVKEERRTKNMFKVLDEINVFVKKQAAILNGSLNLNENVGVNEELGIEEKIRTAINPHRPLNVLFLGKISFKQLCDKLGGVVDCYTPLNLNNTVPVKELAENTDIIIVC